MITTPTLHMIAASQLDFVCLQTAAPARHMLTACSRHQPRVSQSKTYHHKNNGVRKLYSIFCTNPFNLNAHTESSRPPFKPTATEHNN